EQRLDVLVTGPPRVFPGNGSGGDDVDGTHLDHAGSGPVPMAGRDLRPPPAAEGDRDRSVPYALSQPAFEEHAPPGRRVPPIIASRRGDRASQAGRRRPWLPAVHYERDGGEGLPSRSWPGICTVHLHLHEPSLG